MEIKSQCNFLIQGLIFHEFGYSIWKVAGTQDEIEEAR